MSADMFSARPMIILYPCKLLRPMYSPADCGTALSTKNFGKNRKSLSLMTTPMARERNISRNVFVMDVACPIRPIYLSFYFWKWVLLQEWSLKEESQTHQFICNALLHVGEMQFLTWRFLSYRGNPGLTVEFLGSALIQRRSSRGKTR